MRETFEDWGETAGFRFEYGGRHRAGLRKDGKNTVSFLLRWPADIPIGHVAYCQNWYDRGGFIVESDIAFNMQLARFTTRRTNRPDSYYIEGLLAHEIGHMLGLGHSESESSIMRQKPGIEDSRFEGGIDSETVAEYRTLYGKGDASMKG